MIGHLFLIGFDHTVTPRALRERVAAVELSAHPLRHAVRCEAPQPDDAEHSVALLATCHRTEVYGVARNPELAIASTLRHLSIRLGVAERILRRSARICVGIPVARHLFEVASGMHSVVRGESQILGQIKETLHQALEDQTSGPILNTLFRAAVECGKLVRTHAPVGVASASLADLALRMLSADERSRLSEASTDPNAHPVVVGSGRMAAVVVSRLYRLGCRHLTVVSNDPNAAERLTIGSLSIRVVPPSELFAALRATPLAFFCNRSPRPLVTQEDAVHVQSPELAAEGGQVLIDLAHPRAVDWNEAPAGVRLINLASLEAHNEGAQPLTDTRAVEAANLVNQRVEAFVTWCEERAAVPWITSVTQSIDSMVDEELADALLRLEHVDERTAAALTRLVKRVANRASHIAIESLKGQARAAAQSEAEPEDESESEIADHTVSIVTPLTEAVAQ